MIKNIIFDIGGVLFSYRCKEMLMSYGLPDKESEKVAALLFDDPLWAELDIAGRDREEAITTEYMEKYPDYAEAIHWFFHHTEQMQVPRKNIWNLVHKIKEQGYRMYLLSNYPETLFEIHTEDADFMKDMDGGVISYQIHEAKPDPVIYRHLLDKYSLNPEECLYFDALAQNTKAAEAFGIQTITVTSEEFLEKKLEELLQSH